jgi:hypothetical protein
LNEYNIGIDELEKFIKEELPENGEWFHDGWKIFLMEGWLMNKQGFDIDTVKTMLRNFYNAVKKEYEG